MTKVLTICFIFMFAGVVSGEELVVNKDGNLVPLKDDHTWVLWEEIDTPGGDGKVVFRIIEGIDKHATYEMFDDFNEFSHYSNHVGCEYTIEAENKTEHKVKVNKVAFILHGDGDPNIGMYWDQIIEPGQKFATSGYLRATGRGIETEIKLTGPEVGKLFQKYGCDAQSGRVYFYEYDTPLITFSKESNIFGAAARLFVETSQTGKYPILEKITWRD